MSMTHGGAKIETRGLGRRFGDLWAVRDVNLTIAPGSIAVIIGGSGAGKTTLLRLMIGLDQPTEGHLLIDDQDTTTMNERQRDKVRQQMGMVFQYSALLDSLTVYENVAFPLREHRKDLKEKQIKERVIEKLHSLELRDTETKLPSELSGGMRKRTALARALMLEPSVLFYDEPTSGLDPLSARMVDGLIAETRDKFGVTSVVISHDMAGALNIADHLYLLSEGRVVSSGTPAALSQGEDPLAQSFFEASGIRSKHYPR